MQLHRAIHPGLALALLVLCSPLWGQGPIVINEIRTDQTGADDDEYFELFGPADDDLDGLTYVVIGDGGTASGTIEAVISLDGLVIPGTGYFVAAESTFTLGTADFVTTLNFENSDNVTHLLVQGFTGAVGDDLDLDDDCTLDVFPWDAVVDAIALVEEDNPPAGTECHYGDLGAAIGPDGIFVPGHIGRCPDGTGDWTILQFDPAAMDDTPGAANQCATCDPVIDFTCTSDCGTGDVALAWTNVSTYSEIQILRDGMLVTSLMGGDESYTDLAVAPGVYVYTVSAQCPSGIVVETDCAIAHCGPAIDPDLKISEVVDGTLDTGRPRWVEIHNCGDNTIDLSFYSFGNYNNGDTVLGGGDSTLLGGMLGPDESHIFEYDAMADSRFAEVYGFAPDQFAGGTFINGNDALALFYGLAVEDSSDNAVLIDVYGVIGQDGIDEDWEYTDSYAFRQPGAGPNPTFDINEWFVAALGALIGPDPMVEDDEIMLLQTLTTPGLHECGGDPSFEHIRGDFNGDATWNALVDSIFALNAGFVPGSPQPPCEASADADGNGTVNFLVDSIFNLNAGFVPGSPPPPAPWDQCGTPTPEDEALGCTTPGCP